MSDESIEAFLQRIHKDEEDYMIVLSIRDELMENVFEECFKNYLKNQGVKFIVQCAYDAMIKYLSFEFYYHPEVPDVNQSLWIPDEPIESSPKDSWAAEAVPLQPKVQQTEMTSAKLEEDTEEKEEGGHEKTPSISSDNRSVHGFEPKCCACLGHPCTCLVTADISCKLFDEILEKANTTVKSSSQSKHSSLAEKQLSDTANEVIREKSNTNEADVPQPQSLISTQETDLETPTIALLSEILEKSKVPTPKIKEVTAPKQIHETEYLEDLLRSANASTVKLPALRVKSTLQFKPISKPSKKGKF
ncbi:unnamed protein product [Ceutorhynchus assimilis]|uniref:Uncharacterized protein n=1 Tax=Ceutorhynchus assimilis TaxID=467358 RepID=A0A9N9MF90_9CUCU|nr:unnamed protein product [Ceutorhynchus assimilis]